jgi:hypothetical protein
MTFMVDLLGDFLVNKSQRVRLEGGSEPAHGADYVQRKAPGQLSLWACPRQWQVCGEDERLYISIDLLVKTFFIYNLTKRCDKCV